MKKEDINVDEIIKDNKTKSNITYVIAIICIVLCIPLGIIFGRMLVSDDKILEVDKKYAIEDVLKKKGVELSDLDVAYNNDNFIVYSIYLGSNFGQEYIVYFKNDNKYLNNIVGENKNIIYYDFEIDNYFFVVYYEDNVLKTDIYKYNDKLFKVETIDGIIEKYDNIK